MATVNGVAISAVDLAQAIAATARGDGGHGGAPGTARPDRDQVLATVIDQELAAQRATALGLDADPGYREELARLEAQVTGFRRQRLAVLLERDVGAKAPVDPAAVRAYYDQHAARIGTQTRVWQILLRDDTVANTAAGELATGAPFEEVAARTLPAPPPPGTAPWDLGYLAWNQLPEAWLPELARLQVGGTSGVIAGPRGRRWIIKVVDRRADPEATFERARPIIELALQAQAATAARAELAQTLRQGARIELTPRPR